MTGGSVRTVRLNVTLPAGEVNMAIVRLVNVSLPTWNGFPQPGGGFPLLCDNGLVARQKTPSILAHLMPQCVYSRYGRPRSTSRATRRDAVACEPQPKAANTTTSTSKPRTFIRQHYARDS
jgi:hypothetical protein